MAANKKTKKIDIYTKTDFDPEVAEEICRILSEGIRHPVSQRLLPNMKEAAEAEMPYIKNIEREVNGDEVTEWLNVTQVCSFVGITTRTLRVWLARYLEFRDQFDVARELYVDHLVEEAIQIADQTNNDVMVVATKGGDIKLKPFWDNVNRDKLRVETRLKVASKLFPARYGDKIEINSTNTHVHIDETREAKMLRIRNTLEEAKKKGYSIKDILGSLGLTEVNVLANDWRPETQNISEKLLEAPQTLRFEKHRATDAVHEAI
jgi:hypothetical protein